MPLTISLIAILVNVTHWPLYLDRHYRSVVTIVQKEDILRQGNFLLLNHEQMLTGEVELRLEICRLSTSTISSAPYAVTEHVVS